MAADSHGDNYGEHYGRNSLKLYFASAISPKITNKKWEGDVKGGRGDRVSIMTYGANAWEDYVGDDITFNTITEVEGQLVLEKQRHNAFVIKDWKKFIAYANDLESTELKTVAALLKQEVDAYNLSFWSEAGSVVGTDYTTGTVTVTTGTGAVTGSSTVFTDAHIGQPITFAGTDGVFKVKSRATNTSIVVCDMEDENAYSGGAVTAGTSYIIEAAVKVAVTEATIDTKILNAKEKLDRKSVTGDTCPKEGRFLVIPSQVETILLQSSQLTPYTPSAYEDVTKLGIIGMYRGFKVYVSEEVAGNNTDGFHCLAGHEKGITHAFVQIASATTELESNFGKGLKQLVAYGSEVLEPRRKCLVDLFITVSHS